MTSVAVPSLSPVRVRVRAGRFWHIDYHGVEPARVTRANGWSDIEVPCPVCVARGGPCAECLEGAQPGLRPGPYVELVWWEVDVAAARRWPFPEATRKCLDVGLGDAFFHYFHAINPVSC